MYVFKIYKLYLPVHVYQFKRAMQLHFYFRNFQHQIIFLKNTVLRKHKKTHKLLNGTFIQELLIPQGIHVILHLRNQTYTW